MFGLLFRMLFGPDVGQDLLSICDPPDDMYLFDDEECKIHYLYGEEFFGTLRESMFTTFRFMVGDFSTRGGKSLIIYLSEGYGMQFDLAFMSFMVLMLFGVFNIITAIFVDSTIAGLKHNDVKRKHMKMYERKYVKQKLRVLLERVQEVFQNTQTLACRRQARRGEVSEVNMMRVEFAEEDFVTIMEDAVVKVLLADLDIELHNPANLFETFDFNGDGTINLVEIVKGLMKLRGEPQKNDVIAAWVALRSLHEKVDQLQLLHIDMSSRLVANMSGQVGEDSSSPRARASIAKAMPASA